MAEPKGILALLGARPDSSDGGGEGELSPKARAMRDMARAEEEEDWEGMAEAFQRAYSICRMKGAEEPASSSEDEYEEE